MSRASPRISCGSIGWVDTLPLMSVEKIIADITISTVEWNLYICPEGDVRHAFVIQKIPACRTLLFFDYQGKRFIEDPKFCSTIIFKALKKSRPDGYSMAFGQVNEILGEDHAQLCLKNSAFVMHNHCPPANNHFNSFNAP